MFKSRHTTSLHTWSFSSPDWPLPLWSLWVTLPVILPCPNLSLPPHNTDSFSIHSGCWKKLQSLEGEFIPLSLFLCPHLSLPSLCPSLGHVLSEFWHVPPTVASSGWVPSTPFWFSVLMSPSPPSQNKFGKQISPSLSACMHVMPYWLMAPLPSILWDDSIHLLLHITKVIPPLLYLSLFGWCTPAVAANLDPW
jgi:hypothetical protein